MTMKKIFMTTLFGTALLFGSAVAQNKIFSDLNMADFKSHNDNPWDWFTVTPLRRMFPAK